MFGLMALMGIFLLIVRLTITYRTMNKYQLAIIPS